MKIVNTVSKVVKQASKWRESASLIILSKDTRKSKEDSDYRVLLFSRHEKSSFMPATSVFPGGVYEKVDESLLWRNHFTNMGIKEEQFRKLLLEEKPKLEPHPNIFQGAKGDHLQRDISLRITAIRETFEEMGILLCRPRKSLLEDNDGFGTYFEDFDRTKWQHLVHNDASEFLNLCKNLDVVPDLWSLNEWSVWLTPADKKKRFEAAFYLVALRDTPNVILEENEGTDYQWLTPKEALIANMNDKIILAPPQIYELSRLLNFEELNEVRKFAQQRALCGTIVMQPSRQKCTDGMVSLLPGDSNYPSDPNEFHEQVKINMTKEQYRYSAEKLHRLEFNKTNFGEIHINFDPIDGHLKPINISSLCK